MSVGSFVGEAILWYNIACRISSFPAVGKHSLFTNYSCEFEKGFFSEHYVVDYKNVNEFVKQSVSYSERTRRKLHVYTLYYTAGYTIPYLKSGAIAVLEITIMASPFCLLSFILAAAISGTYSESGLTAAQKQQLVDAHNFLRQRVKPAATNMLPMVWILVSLYTVCYTSMYLCLLSQKWNDELATIAQNYANKCIWAHNPRRISRTFSKVGENIYAGTGTVSNYLSVVQKWYDEVENYHYSTNTCDSGKVCGHYTQVSSPMYTHVRSVEESAFYT